MYSYLLRGDLSLSITMTALSTILALAMLPLWLYTLGTQFSDSGELSIPFEMVAVSLSILIIPLLVGLFFRQKLPKIANMIQKLLKPVIVVISIALLVIGIISNMYIFRMFEPRVILAGLLLPYVGYICGGIVALIFRQSWKRIKTIALETGMQNTNIAYILLVHSFPAPYGDIAAIGPVASAVMTPLPPFTITIFYLLYQKFCNKNKDKDNAENGDKSGTNGSASKNGEEEKLTAEVTSCGAADDKPCEEKLALTKV